MELDLEYSYTGVDRGWTGDVPKMRLSIEKLASLGWVPAQSSHETLGRSARELSAELVPEHTAADSRPKSTQ